jgi:hypothetical protein
MVLAFMRNVRTCRQAESTDAQHRGRNGVFLGFNPGISQQSAKAIRQEMRSRQLHLRSDLSLEQMAAEVNPVLRGWINYYGAHYRSALIPIIDHFDHILSRWAVRKYNHLKHQRWKALRWIRAYLGDNPSSLLIGMPSAAQRAGWWEPYEMRVSRTVLREPGGGIPPVHSATNPPQSEPMHSPPTRRSPAGRGTGVPSR